jgi:hypothetical protein
MLNSERYSANTADECKRIPLLCVNHIEMSMGRPGEWVHLAATEPRSPVLTFSRSPKSVLWNRHGLALCTRKLNGWKGAEEAGLSVYVPACSACFPLPQLPNTFVSPRSISQQSFPGHAKSNTPMPKLADGGSTAERSAAVHPERTKREIGSASQNSHKRRASGKKPTAAGFGRTRKIHGKRCFRRTGHCLDAVAKRLKSWMRGILPPSD